MNTPKISFRLPQEQLNKIDILVKAGIFKDRSAFLRTAIEQLLTDALPQPDRKIDSAGVMG